MSKTPVCDHYKREWRDGFGHYAEWVPFDVAAKLETDRAELVEALQNLTTQPPRTINCNAARALLARLEAE